MSAGSANPFRFNRPTPPQEFLGRGALVQRLVEELGSWNGDSYALIGGRRFGKSSLLGALERALLEGWRVAGDGDLRVLPVRFSLQEIPRDAPDDFFGFARERTFLALEDVLPGTVEAPPATPATLQEFEKLVLRLVAAAKAPLRVALLIDEMDRALESSTVGALFGNLRSLVSTGPANDHVRLVAAGVGRFRELDGKDSPLFNVCNPEFLEAFDDLGVQALLARAGDLDAGVAEALSRAAGGHPFILQFLLHHLFRAGIATTTPAILEDVLLRFTNDRRPDLEAWWRAVGPEGRASYAVLARTSEWTSVATVVAALDGARARVKRGLDALSFHGLALQRRSGREYRVGSELFRDWCAQQPSPLPRAADGGLLPLPLIFEIHSAAVDLGLPGCRAALLSAIAPTISAGLPHAGDPSSQLLGDLQTLNRIPGRGDEAPPLATWLEAALQLRQARIEAQVLRDALDALGVP